MCVLDLRSTKQTNFIMKKITTVAAIALFAVAFTSCKKNYTCECTTTTNGVTTTVKGNSAKMSKKDAKALCDQGDYTSASLTTDCEAK